MPKKILISGSLAYDYIMDFPDSFKNHILPEQIHILNVSFVVDALKKELGGCAGNIGYTVKLLGGDPLIVGALGKDSSDYIEHLKKYDISTKYIHINKEIFSSSAHITTDKDDNQICAFHPGAGNEAGSPSIETITEEIAIAIVSPTKKEVMIKHAKECEEKEIPLVFDPGQQLTALSPQELMLIIGQAKFLIVNDYELKLVEEKTGWGKQEILNHVDVLITTLGEKGSEIATSDELININPCPATSVDDPTGAGDAYRAGFFTAYLNDNDLKTCGQVASVTATYAVENYGTQKHSYSKKEFAERYKSVYGEEISL